MEFSIFRRCETREFETRLSVCMNCNYGLDTDGAGEIPIPAWVLKHVSLTPSELEEIREINFGFQSRPVRRDGQPAHPPDNKSSAPVPIRFQHRRAHAAIKPVETNQCVM